MFENTSALGPRKFYVIGCVTFAGVHRSRIQVVAQLMARNPKRIENA